MIAAVLPAELVVRVVAEAGRPLRAVRVEAEEVRRLHLQRRVLRAGDAVDERLVRVLLRVVGDRDALVAGERADRGRRRPPAPSGAASPRSPCRRCRRRSRSRRSRSSLPATLAPVDAVARLLARRLGAGVLDQRQVGARDGRLEERAEGALAVGQEADLDRAALLRRGSRCRLRRPRRRRRRRRRATSPRASKAPISASSLLPSKHLSPLSFSCQCTVSGHGSVRCGPPSPPGPAPRRRRLAVAADAPPRGRRGRRARAGR